MTGRSGQAPVIVLFRRDLRVADNRALGAAAASGHPVLPLIVVDDGSDGVRPAGGASRWWQRLSIERLVEQLTGLGARPVVRRGAAAAVARALAGEIDAAGVFWNRRYEPAAAAADAVLKTGLRDAGGFAQSFDGALLHEPSMVRSGQGRPFRVFTPFWKAISSGLDPRDPADPPRSLRPWDGAPASEDLRDILPLPAGPDWAGGLRERWEPGEEGALRRLDAFVDGGLSGYAESRDRADREATSMLSPHLAFGEVTPFQIFAALRGRGGNDAAKFRSEVGWREFCYHLLFSRDDLHERNVQPKFDGFAWQADEAGLNAWKRGRTGYPLVDAGMRELWRTGWMHNRVRMVAASFLVKHLLIDWRAGERWFWDTLVDADPANNPASWQWVAGSGADAAPYFRIFNPILQGERFDPDGDYVRRHVPELARLPARYIHRPWEAPEPVLAKAGVGLGGTYPRPVVDHGRARARALAAYQAIRDDAGDKAS